MQARRVRPLTLVMWLGVALGARAEPDASTIRHLPFEPAGTNRIAVELSPEGSAHRLPLIVDTGASHSFMSPGVARRLGIPVRAAKSSPYRRATRLGRDLSFLIDASTSDTHSKMPEEFGLLGGNFLARFVLELDFHGRRVGFLEPPERPEDAAPGDAISVPLTLVSDRPHLEITVDGSPLRVLLDTGDPFSLSLMRDRAQKLGIASSRVGGLVVWGVLGPLRVELGEVRTVGLGPFELEQVPVLVHEGSYNQGDATGAAIGVDLLSLFDVRIDYPGRRLWLRQRSKRATLFGADYQRVRASGAFLERAPEEDDAIYVRWVLPDSPAERLGLRPGDWLSPLVLEEQQLDLEGVHRRVEAGGPLEVVREEEGDWVERQLPASVSP
jgi:predicted aspartyl protease